MILSLTFEDGLVEAKAEGHPTDVINEFHEMCSVLLSPYGPWRISQVHGTFRENTDLDSKMRWQLTGMTKKLSQE